jgi:hypothetical protein
VRTPHITIVLMALSTTAVGATGRTGVHMNIRRLPVLLPAMVLAIGLMACSRSRSDAEITAEVQSRIHADAALTASAITVQSNAGVVVLSGKVETDTARISAESIAKQVGGVKGVVNNLEVVAADTPSPAAAQAPAEQEVAKQQMRKVKPTVKQAAKPVEPAAAVASTPPAPVPAPQVTQPAAEPARVTIPEGTTITVRLIDAVDSEKNKEGDTFSASLDSPIVIDDKTVIPKNADVVAKLVSATSAGHFTGSSEVVLVLTRITFAGKSYDIQTGQYTKQGASRGKRSAAIIGGGAAAGAVIGAIAGGGKGAAIGAAAGAGTGTGVQALTKGQQIKLPAETLLEFQLSVPLTVTPAGEMPKRETVG